MPALRDQTAVVTGASSGIGEAMARLLAGWGADVVIAARRLDRLQALAGELSKTGGVRVIPIQVDLSVPDGPATLWAEACAALAPKDGARIAGPDIWINNAGGGAFEPYADVPWDQHAAMLQLNVTSIAELSHRFIASALGRTPRAYLLNVSSIGAYFSVRNFANYGAGKAYVRNFSEALAAEVSGTNVSVTCLCPGGTATEFFERSGQNLPWLSQKTAMMTAERCARIGLSAMFRGRRNVVAGTLNAFACWLARLVPRSTATAAAPLFIGQPTRQLPANILDSDHINPSSPEDETTNDL